MSSPTVEGSFIKWEDALTGAELDAITAYGDRMLHRKAELAQPTDRNYDDVRVTKVAWMEYNPETAAFFNRISQLVRQLNEQFYHFDLTGLENLQYTVYHGTEGGHYNWHIDYGAHNPRPRKISLSIQLSDGDSYEGCDLQFQTGTNIGTAPRKRGTAIAFPSFFLHRVTPITAGTRKSLVVWAAGPIFR
jgi:PKHD-type hydroxylase